MQSPYIYYLSLRLSSMNYSIFCNYSSIFSKIILDFLIMMVHYISTTSLVVYFFCTSIINRPHYMYFFGHHEFFLLYYCGLLTNFLFGHTYTCLWLSSTLTDSIFWMRYYYGLVIYSFDPLTNLLYLLALYILNCPFVGLELYISWLLQFAIYSISLLIIGNLWVFIDLLYSYLLGARFVIYILQCLVCKASTSVKVLFSLNNHFKIYSIC